MKLKTLSRFLPLFLLTLCLAAPTVHAYFGYVASAPVDGFWASTPEYDNGSHQMAPSISETPTKSGNTVTVKVLVDKGYRGKTTYTFTIQNFSCDQKYELSQWCNVWSETYTIDLHRDPGHVVSSWSSTGATSHKGKCKFCGKTLTEAHVYDNSCDTTCNTCGYVRTITHDYRAATCLTPKTCNICGATDGTALGHSYTDGYCTVCGMEEKSGVIHITTAEQLKGFADTVFGGQTKISAVLDNDIDMSAYPDFRIGTSAHPFEATFDGKEHTIKVALVGETYTAPFGFIGRNATVKNLIVEGTVNASGKHAAGLIACISDVDVTVQNCISLVDIISTVDGDGLHGGLVGLSSGYHPKFYSCAFLGSIKGEKTTGCGGLVGWVEQFASFKNCLVAAKIDENMNISGCNTIARYNTRNRMSVKNCYYLNALGTVPSGAYSVSGDELKSGGAAYLLNGSTNGGTNWYQNIDNGQTVDVYPVPFSTHGAVYYAYRDCAAEEQSYTNSKKTVMGHVGGTPNCLTKGYCTDCGEAYLPIDPDTHAISETYYKTVDETTHGLYHSCCNAQVKTEAHTMTDATCTGIAYCTVCGAYYGSLDKTNHTGNVICEPKKYSKTEHEYKYDCCGAVVKTEKHNLVYTADDSTKTISAVCRDCAANGSVTLTSPGGVYKGFDYTADYTATGIFDVWRPLETPTFEYCCHADGCNVVGTHHVTMTLGGVSVGEDFEITPKTLTVAHIKSDYKSYDNSPYIEVVDVVPNGVVVYDAGEYDGEWDDIADNVSIELEGVRAYVSDSVPGAYATANVTGLILKGSDSANYVLASSANDVSVKSTFSAGSFRIYSADVHVTPSDQTLKGENEELDQTKYELNYMPDGFVVEGIALKSDDYGRIYADFENLKVCIDDEACTDVTDYFNFTTSYANLSRVCLGHTVDENGFCASGNCNSYEAAVLNDNGTENTDDDFYEVSNAGQLYWIAEQVNNYGKTNISVKLMKDITVNADLSASELRTWMPIDNYYGTFNGNGHSISGLYCVLESGYAGVFGTLGYYPVSDLHIKNSRFSGSSAGAIVGYANGSTLTKCSVASDVKVVGTTEAGGLIADASVGTMVTNCGSQAEVTTENGAYRGGLVGYNCAYLQNCYTSDSAVVGYNNENYGGAFDKVYFLSDTEDSYDGTIAKSAEDFDSGAVAYLLQSAVEGELIGYDDNDEPVYATPEQIWGQKIGSDAYPTIGKDTVVEDEYTDRNNVTTKAYRNTPIDGTKILRLGKDKKSATLLLDKAGSYIVYFVDRDGKRLTNLRMCSFKVTKPQAVHISSERDFTLEAGDKVFLFGNMFAVPACEAYIIK